jgi:hypothetical protein
MKRGALLSRRHARLSAVYRIPEHFFSIVTGFPDFAPNLLFVYSCCICTGYLYPLAPGLRLLYSCQRKLT